MSKSMKFTWLPTNQNISLEVIKDGDVVYAELSVYESFDGYTAVLEKEQIDELIMLLKQAKECFDE